MDHSAHRSTAGATLSLLVPIMICGLVLSGAPAGETAQGSVALLAAPEPGVRAAYVAERLNPAGGSVAADVGALRAAKFLVEERPPGKYTMAQVLGF